MASRPTMALLDEAAADIGHPELGGRLEHRSGVLRSPDDHDSIAISDPVNSINLQSSMRMSREASAS